MSLSPFGVRSEERVALVIDGPSLYQTSKNLGFDVDYRKLMAHLEEICRFHRAHYYTLLREGEGGNAMMPLIDWLDFHGFRLVTKPLREFEEDGGRRRVKGTVVPEMCVDLVEIATQVDHILLISGDGELAYAVEAAQRKGTKVTVISSLRTSPAAISDDLRRKSDRFVDLSDLRDQIGREASRSGAERGSAGVVSGASSNRLRMPTRREAL